MTVGLLRHRRPTNPLRQGRTFFELIGLSQQTSSGDHRPAEVLPHHDVHLSDLAVTLVGKPLGPLQPVLDWLSRAALLAWSPPTDAGLMSLCRTPRRSGVMDHLLIIDVDAFGGVCSLMEPLLLFRRQRPDIVVILASVDFSSDDIDLERLPLCDASLRLPLSLSRLEFALNEAIEVNNPIWQSRVSPH